MKITIIMIVTVTIVGTIPVCVTIVDGHYNRYRYSYYY
jgi:hypothetical protein